MQFHSSLLWSWNRTIDRLPYLATGVLLFILKFFIDWTIAAHGFGQHWSPFNYLIWPNDQVLRVFELGHEERRFSITMLAVSLPFIWTGVVLTLHRLRAAGLPLSLILFFFVPVVNLLLFLILVLLPTKEVLTAVAVPQPVRRNLEPWRNVHRNFVEESYWRSGLVALAISVPPVVDFIIHRIHGQVLEHIKRLAEGSSELR
jgi:uncharacterized membrane protein YhaH (DUF805 family)